MNRNRFVLLIGLTVAALLAVVLLTREPVAPTAQTGALVPGLDAAINQVDAIDIVAPGGAIAVSLRRDEARWRVTQKDGYEAEFNQVVELLRALAEAETVEPRTDNPDWYTRLGVQDLGAADATGRRVDFPGGDLPSVLIGQTDPSGLGSYARRAGEAQSWLLNRTIELPIDPVMWLEPGIMDIPSSDIESVTIRHADGETIRLARAEVGDDGAQSRPEFVLLDVPEGRAAGQAWRRNATANGLRSLNLEDVRRFQPPVPDNATRVLFTTTDGLHFIAQLFAAPDPAEADSPQSEPSEAAPEPRYWAHFSVSAEPVAPAESKWEESRDPDAEQETPTGVEDPAGDALEPEQSDPAAERLANAVAADARLSPWLFEITKTRYDDLTRRLEDFLEPLEQEQTGED